MIFLFFKWYEIIWGRAYICICKLWESVVRTNKKDHKLTGHEFQRTVYAEAKRHSLAPCRKIPRDSSRWSLHAFLPPKLLTDTIYTTDLAHWSLRAIIYYHLWDKATDCLHCILVTNNPKVFVDSLELGNVTHLKHALNYWTNWRKWAARCSCSN